MMKITRLTVVLIAAQILSGCAFSEGKGQASYYEGIASHQDIKKISPAQPQISRKIIATHTETSGQTYRITNTRDNKSSFSDNKPSTETQQFREHIRIGDQSQCGMIVKIRKPIVKVQMTYRERWIKISEIYPASSGRSCPIDVDSR
ncbi:MAG: hypothetical protein M0003_03550 [Acidithiobacillus sp.]|nr:hypothetical protein [Acidithiobacillus sp.]